MKILLLAYACEPYRGSEPGIGWKWALNMVKDPDKDVYVLTRRNNKDVIDQYWNSNTCPSNLHFFYYDLTTPFVWAKHHGLPVNLYYAWWLYGAAKYALNLHKKIHFDIGHHLTFGVFRNPCVLYKLKIPYVVGPVGGGDVTPSQFLSLYSKKEILREKIRIIANKISFVNPILQKTLNNASLIFAKTQDTKNLLSKWNSKTFVNLEIGIEAVSQLNEPRNKEVFLFVGRFIYLKGVRLVLNAFKEFSKTHSNARMLMIGKGEMEKYITQYANENNLNIEIIPWIKQEELKKYYSTACAMVFPSLHDSSGNVVLEALSFGLPVICLDCGGPATILGNTLMDTVVSTRGKSIDDVVNDIVDNMEHLYSDDEFYLSVQEKAYKRAESFLWKKMVNETYSFIEKKLLG